MAMQFFRSQFFSYAQPFEIDQPVAPIENPATAVDRAYLEAQMLEGNMTGNVFSYDRAPVAGEWTDTVPHDAFVRVFAINEYTSVRVLHTAAGQRIAEPAIDSWRPSTTYVAAP